MTRRMWALVLAGTIVAGASGPGRAAGFFEMNFYLSGPRYSAKVPLCTEPGPLGRIQGDFHTKERRYWVSELRIVNFENVRELAVRPWAADSIPRRFCAAEAMVSDGVRRPVYYSIIEDQGFTGISYGVEWCVVGLDRNWAYSPACTMAKP
jgi:hypothetical protein